MEFFLVPQESSHSWLHSRQGFILGYSISSALMPKKRFQKLTFGVFSQFLSNVCQKLRSTMYQKMFLIARATNPIGKKFTLELVQEIQGTFYFSNINFSAFLKQLTKYFLIFFQPIIISTHSPSFGPIWIEFFSIHFFRENLHAALKKYSKKKMYSTNF